MIKLKIKKFDKDRKVIEEVIDFEGDYENDYIIESSDYGLLIWKPVLLFDDWEPIEKIV